MADRYEERFRNEPYRDRERGREDRGFVERAGDEVRSWFGDDEAERRRRMDERERDRDRDRDRFYGRDWGRGSERGWNDRPSGESGWGGERWSTGYGRTEFDRPGGSYYGSRGSENEGSRGWSGGYGSGPGYGAGAYGSRSSGSSQGREYGYGGSERWRSGDFSGRGPKGYQRSDNRIIEDVCDRLTDAADVDASNIEVKVNGGEVTLAGTVNDRFDKRRAEELVENISGVREVHNNLRVNRGQENMPGGGSSPNLGGTSGNNPPRR